MQASTGGGGGDNNPPAAAAALNTSHMLGAAATDQSHHHHQQHQQVEAASPISSRPPMDEFMHLSSAGADDDALGAAGDDRGGVSGNRWPRQETLALLRIRSEMDSTFRDATLKGPLWEDVSRKLGELGYKRSAKKCKEKFENVHKYYKRTKEGRAGRQDGKSYKFFSQLEALHATTSTANVSPPPTSTAVTLAPNVIVSSPPPFHPITYNHPLSSPPPPSSQQFPFSATMSPVIPPNPTTGFSSDSTSTSPISDEDYGGDGRKRKRDDSKGGMGRGTRGMMEFFEGLMKQVMQKQESMQQRFLEAVEKREQGRMIREEAWKRQEMARLAREHELMSQERAISASRDAAIISFLQKLTGQTIQLPQHLTVPIPVPSPATSVPPPAPTPTPPPQQQHHQVAMMAVPEQQVAPHAHEASGSAEASSSRWPKAEVLALINLRSGLEGRYQEAGPKGPLWEEVSAGMQRMGYKRSSKRCKEKWENINKYFKKVKESNKKRPEDAKTCPYFHQLDALYRKKSLVSGSTSFSNQNILQQQQESLPATKTPQEPTQTTDPENNNGGRPETQAASSVAGNLFGESTGGNTTTKKPEDIVKDMMMEQQLMVDDYDKINESDEEDIEDEDEEEDEEDEVGDERNKMEYKVEFQRPKTTGPSNGGGNGAPSFLGMVQ